jgi:DNA-binding IclR family transcriptional regulator
VAEAGARDEILPNLSRREAQDVHATGSLVRAVAIVRAVASTGRAGASISDVAQRTRLPRPTVHRVCHMLQDIGWLERDEANRRFVLGLEMATLGMTAQLCHPLEELARPVLSRLSKQTEQTFYLIVRSGNDAICMARCESGAQIRTLVLEVGARQPLGIGAGSMAILAALAPDEIAQVIASNRERYLERATFDEAVFREELSRARERGYAEHDGLFARGLSGIGVAVRERSGLPLAAVSTAFISHSLDAAQQRLCVARMEAGAKEIASRLALPAQSSQEQFPI